MPSKSAFQACLFPYIYNAKDSAVPVYVLRVLRSGGLSITGTVGMFPSVTNRIESSRSHGDSIAAKTADFKHFSDLESGLLCLMSSTTYPGHILVIQVIA